MKHQILALSFAGALSLVSFNTMADGHENTKATSEKQAQAAVTFRKSILQLVRSNIGALGAMAKGKIPMDADVIAKNANRVAFLGDMMHDYFALDTSGYTLDTDAESSIWKNHSDFSNKVDDMVKAATSLEALVVNKQVDDFRKGINALSRTCKACHDDYKKD